MAEELKKENTAPEQETPVQEEAVETPAAEELSQETADNASQTTEEEQTATERKDSDQKDTDKKEKKSLFGKKKEIEALNAKIEELTDKNLRQMAEFNNFRNRTEKEKAARFDMGAKSVIEKILPIVDNFERGLASVPEDQKEDAFVSGMDKVYKQLMTQLEAMDVKPIEAVGKEFNPDFHNAVMQVASEEYESGIVTNEFQKGYTYKDSVVRHSMVAVAQ